LYHSCVVPSSSLTAHSPRAPYSLSLHDALPIFNTLFVLTEDSYLSLDGENVVISQEKKEVGRFPLHTLESILCFSYPGASPALRSEEHTSELQSRFDLVCRLLLEKKKRLPM